MLFINNRERGQHQRNINMLVQAHLPSIMLVALDLTKPKTKTPTCPLCRDSITQSYLKQIIKIKS
jgi:hypothetical protein